MCILGNDSGFQVERMDRWMDRKPTLALPTLQNRPQLVELLRQPICPSVCYQSLKLRRQLWRPSLPAGMLSQGHKDWFSFNGGFLSCFAWPCMFPSQTGSLLWFLRLYASFYSSYKSSTTLHRYFSNCKHMFSVLPTSLQQSHRLCLDAEEKGHKRGLECSV